MADSICIIPARKGSKSIKDKNLQELNHKTLVRIAVEKAMESGIFKRVIITTDYDRYKLRIDGLKSVSGTGLYSVKRPAELATDEALMIDVVKHALYSIGGEEQWVWLFQPTSPFRTLEDIHRIDKELKTGKWESVISFKPVEDYTDRTYTYKDGQAHRIKHTTYKNRQKIIPQVTRSGHYYITKREHIQDKNTFEVKPFHTFMMGGIDPEKATMEDILWSLNVGENIDNARQLELVKSAVRRGDYIP